MDVSTEDCVTFYTSNTIITVASGIDANEPFQNKAGKENRLTGMKFSCLFEWGQNGQGFKKKKVLLTLIVSKMRYNQYGSLGTADLCIFFPSVIQCMF